jgi:predicted metalloprotease
VIRILLLAATLGAACALVGNARAGTSSQQRYADPQGIARWAAPRLNAYWNGVLAKDGVTYRNPRYFYWYNGPGYGWLHTPRRCDIYRKRDGLMWAGYSREYTPNSFYCGPNENFYFDWSFWKTLNRGGAVFVAAHEWGHHAQALLRWPVRERQRRHAYANYELMADCYAGTFMRHERDAGTLTARDAAQAKHLVGRLGDFERTPWSKPQSHGSPADRRKWFSNGYESGDPKVCAALFGRYQTRGPAAIVSALASSA